MLVNIFSIQNQKEKKKINIIKAAMEILTEKIGISTFFSYYVLIENIFENNIEKNIIKNIYIYIYSFTFFFYMDFAARRPFCIYKNKCVIFILIAGNYTYH